MPNREIIKRLQHAHAGYIESGYRQQLILPGNPFGIEIHQVGKTRVFICNHDRFENRAIFTGNETESEFREITSLFEEKSVKGFFELNPANFYRTEPFSWKSEVMQSLLKLGYKPADFRCVWYLEKVDDIVEAESEDCEVKGYTSDKAHDFVKAKMAVEPVPDEKAESEENLLLNSFTESWRHYIGYEEEKPVSTSSLFITGETGYLAWGFTQKPHRRKHHHWMHVKRRVKDAFSMGCSTVFSVTDFNIPSSRSLQKYGFKLAYNYLLMEWIPRR